MTTLTVTGQVLAERYELTRFLAGGSMGEVWLADDRRMQRTVAVKVLRPEFARDPVAVERFRIEARLAARLVHPGIARVHDVDDGRIADEPPWMVQEYVPGRPLSDLVAAGDLLPQRVADLIAQAAEAVHAAHEVGVVHRDLTPGNLLVTDDDVVKITDFGIARAAGQVPLTATGHILGAAAYLSPEQVRGRPATPASDVYTLGVVLHECLTGSRPFSGATLIDVARAHLHQEPPPLPATVPDVLRTATAAAMAKDPADRPASAAELSARLRAAAAEGVGSRDVQATPAPPGHTRRLPSVRHRAKPAPRPRVTAPRLAVDAAVTGAGGPAASSTGAAVAIAAAAGQTSASLAASLDAIRRNWRGWWPQAVRLAREIWRRYPISRVGLSGVALLILVVAAVIFAASDANGAPATDTSEPATSTVRVGDEPRKGDG